MNTALVPIVVKVQRLIALAGSDREEEARTAAYVACRFIREHGLRVVAASEVPAAPQSESRVRVERPRAKHPWKIITSRFDAHCPSCRESYFVGDDLAWCRGVGTRCIECAREEGIVR